MSAAALPPTRLRLRLHGALGALLATRLGESRRAMETMGEDAIFQDPFASFAPSER